MIIRILLFKIFLVLIAQHVTCQNSISLPGRWKVAGAVSGSYQWCNTVASFDTTAFKTAKYPDQGAFAVLKKNGINVSQYKMFNVKYKELALEKPNISITQKGDYTVLTSQVFVWRACIDIDGESTISDNCFDLLPGIPYYVKTAKGEKVSVKQSGSDIMLKLKKFNNN